MLRTTPWWRVRISRTLWTADFKFSVPDSAWLTSRSDVNRRISGAWTSPRTGLRARSGALMIWFQTFVIATSWTSNISVVYTFNGVIFGPVTIDGRHFES